MSCRKDELEFTNQEEEKVCIKKSDVKDVGEKHGDWYSAFDYRGIEDSKKFIEDVFLEHNVPRYDYYEKLDEQFWEPLPDSYTTDAMKEEFANQHNLDKEDVDMNDEVRELLQEGFWENYDLIKDVKKALRSETRYGYIPFKKFSEDSGGLLYGFENDDYVENIVEASKGSSSQKEFLEKLKDRVADEQPPLELGWEDDNNEFQPLTMPESVKDKNYLKKILAPKLRDHTDDWGEYLE
jgi:hypothetical protein